ncbi:hypothetical protein [Methylobacterium radiotolerans]|uniref:hypothetical protein n=1 Tax=Methylobacterium radiotolerans TaxID=31998 RepID=UPI00105836B8|nr:MULTISPECIES: hypothetical protein [Methylobacterium]MDE3748602.1 hypothetical protein [Methylobacterium radiotolerans]
MAEAGELNEAGDDSSGEHGLNVHQLLWGGTPSETDMGYPTSDTKVRRAQSEVPTKKPRAAVPAGLKSGIAAMKLPAILRIITACAQSDTFVLI